MSTSTTSSIGVRAGTLGDSTLRPDGIAHLEDPQLAADLAGTPVGWRRLAGEMARRLAAGGVIVRRLDAIENLGGMDVLCTDKTGTLTLGESGASADLLAVAFWVGGVLGLALNGLVMLVVAAVTPPMAPDHLRRFEL